VGGNAPEGGFGLQVFAPADLELRVLGRLLDALPDEPEVSVVVAPENLGGAGWTSESGASGGDSGGDQKLLSRAAGKCEALAKATRFDGDDLRERLSDEHPDGLVRRLRTYDASPRVEGQPGLGLLALRECGCDEVDVAALEEVWTRWMLSAPSHSRAVPVPRRILEGAGDQKLGEWLRSRPARGSVEATAACERDAVEIAAWYSFTRPWHRSGDRPFDVPRVSDANGEIDASELTVRLTIGPERIRPHDTPIDEEIPEGMSPDGKLCDLVEPMREQLTQKLEEKRQEFDLLGEDPPEHLVLVVRSAAELPVEVSKELVDGLGDLAEFRLVVADESAPPLSLARTKVLWVDARLEEARAAETVGELVGSLAAECKSEGLLLRNGATLLQRLDLLLGVARLP
jgi:hypothetical protein